MSCKKTIKDSKIVFQDGESKSKICFNNPNKRKLTRIKIDNCLITSGKRCDFLLINHNSIEHYIELKGKKVEYACTQIMETIEKISENIKGKKHSFIVSSACPLTTTQIQKYKLKFKKTYNSTLIIKNSQCEYNVD